MGQANIRMYVKEICYAVYTGRKLIHDTVQCWYFVKTVMILQVSFVIRIMGNHDQVGDH